MTRALALLFLLTPAEAAPPARVLTAESGVVIEVPVDWKLLVKPEASNITMSSGLATTMTMYWYPYKAGATPDIVLDVLIKTVNQQLPIGKATEVSREAMPGLEGPHDTRRGKRMRATVDAMGYTMTVSMAALIDTSSQRMLAGFLLAPPDTFDDMDAMGSLTEIVESFHLAEDPLLPAPAWWWGAAPPAALVRTEAP